MEQVFNSALPVLEKLKTAGYDAYFVGGAVRDFLLEKSISDIDIATSATPEIVTQLFDHVIPVGIEHGTVLVLLNGNKYEVTTFRTEGRYEDYRHPSSVNFVQDIAKDLARRDFTINAMAMDKYFQIIDPFKGQLDLQNGIIKTVGNPLDRFQEDPLRMMRAVRFVSQLGFTLEEEAYRAILELHSLLNNIAIERISIEFEKILTHYNMEKGIEKLDSLELYKELPIFKDNTSLFHSFKQKVTYPFNMGFAEFIAFMGYEFPEVSPTQWVKQWKLSNEIKQKAEKQIIQLKQFKSSQSIKRSVYNLNNQEVELFGNLLSRIQSTKVTEKVRRIYEGLPIKTRAELSINGNDILSWFPDQTPGPWIELVLKEVEYSVVQGKISNNKTEIKELVQKWKLHGNS